MTDTPKNSTDEVVLDIATGNKAGSDILDIMITHIDKPGEECYMCLVDYFAKNNTTKGLSITDEQLAINCMEGFKNALGIEINIV